jgi:hypothetical protein
MKQMCTSTSSLFEHVRYKHAVSLTRAKNDGNKCALLLPGFPRYLHCASSRTTNTLNDEVISRGFGKGNCNRRRLAISFVWTGLTYLNRASSVSWIAVRACRGASINVTSWFLMGHAHVQAWALNTLLTTPMDPPSEALVPTADEDYLRW